MTATKRNKGYNGGEARTGHSMLTYILLWRNPSSMAVGPRIGTSTIIAGGANHAIIREHTGMYFEVMPPQKMRGGGPGGLL